MTVLEALLRAAPLLRSPRLFLPHVAALLDGARFDGRLGVKRWLDERVGKGAPLTCADWISDRLARRRGRYPSTPLAGTFSLLTSAYDTPPEFLSALAASVFAQSHAPFEWVLVDNGSRNKETREALAQIAREPRVRFVRVEENQGILGGMRAALEHAQGRYVLPLDSDDLLTPDALEILAHVIERERPALLYSDEVKLEGEVLRDAYWKPGWDPVLFANSCYIAHLGAIDRERALALGCYTFPGAQGCHDWDTFFRFQRAGLVPRHVPEVLYAWRMHPQSTSGNVASKSYIHSSHQAVLGLELKERGLDQRFAVEPSPFFGEAPDWWFRRRRVDPRPLRAAIVLHAAGKPEALRTRLEGTGVPVATEVVNAQEGPRALVPVAQRALAEKARLVLVSDRVEPLDDEWAWEALGVPELYPDAAIVGGRILNDRERVLEGARFFGVEGPCGGPDDGRPAWDPGYFAAALKQRSVSAVPGGFCSLDPALLLETLERSPRGISYAFLEAWLGAQAARSGKRVVYSPYFAARARGGRPFPRLPGEEEAASFLSLHASLVPERRYYSPHLGLAPGRAYSGSTPEERGAALRRLRAPARGRAPEGAPFGPCWACGGKLRARYESHDFNRGLSADWFAYGECRRCRSLFIDRVPEDLGRYYPREYYQVPTDYEDFKRSLGGERYRIELLLPYKAKGRLLEIGPGNGVFTQLALDAGFEVEAIEFDAECCDFMRRFQKIRAHRTADPARVSLEPGSFDAIALWNSLEHLPDPIATLRAAARWLRPGGVLLVSVPNPEALQLRLLGRWWPHLDAPRHLCFFTLRALDRILGSEGLALEMKTTSDPGGKFWNVFGWELGFANWARLHGLPGGAERSAAKLGRAVARRLEPLEGQGLRGSIVTAIWRKAGPASSEASRRASPARERAPHGRE
jgi:SAM-dependent methyltransferase